jgi:phage FluMu protein Com
MAKRRSDPAEVRSGVEVRTELAAYALEDAGDPAFPWIDAVFIEWHPPPDRVAVEYQVACPVCRSSIERSGTYLWGHLRDEVKCPQCNAVVAILSADFGTQAGKAVRFHGMYLWSRPSIGAAGAQYQAELSFRHLGAGPTDSEIAHGR